MATISITPLLNEKTNDIIYVTTVKRDKDTEDEQTMKGNYIKFPDNNEDIKFIPSEIPYKVIPRLTERGTIILELNMDQYQDLKYKLATYPQEPQSCAYIKLNKM
ncbi:Hypothetical protein HVR_LOCUS446 [uncultured virus]|nr:Hypothetical protein HVR_LOCUS446 [uncultured virus]